MIASTAAPHRFLRPLRLRSRPHVHLPHQNPSLCFPSTPSPTKNAPIPLSRLPLTPSTASPSDMSSLEAAQVLPAAGESDPNSDPEHDETEAGDGVEVEVAKVGRNRRRIRARVRVDASMEAVWTVLTDYEGLAGFIPSLSVSQLVEKGEGFARIYQVGLQDLALGLKFEAKGTLDCFEKDFELLPSGRKREIEFKMVEGDFQTFEGAWSILQTDQENREEEDKFFQGQEFQTALSYVVELEPKLWLPVRLLEGRLSREVKTNLLCVRDEAQRVQRLGHDALPTW